MFKIGTLVLLLTGAVFSDGFLFPDEVYSKANSESGYGEGNDRSNLNPYGHSYTGQGHRQMFGRHDGHRPAFNTHYNGHRGELISGLDKHHGGPFPHGSRQNRGPSYGGIVSQSHANAQSSGFGSQANSQSGSLSFNGGSQSNSGAQAQSQGYQMYPFGPSGGGGFGASSASSAASATAGIVDGVATASAAAAAASASSGNGGSSSSSSSSSSAAGGNNGGFGNGQNPPWFFRTRVAGEDGDSNAENTNAAPAGDDKLIFSQK